MRVVVDHDCLQRCCFLFLYRLEPICLTVNAKAFENDELEERNNSWWSCFVESDENVLINT